MQNLTNQKKSPKTLFTVEGNRCKTASPINSVQVPNTVQFPSLFLFFAKNGPKRFVCFNSHFKTMRLNDAPWPKRKRMRDGTGLGSVPRFLPRR